MFSAPQKWNQQRGPFRVFSGIEDWPWKGDGGHATKTFDSLAAVGGVSSFRRFWQILWEFWGDEDSLDSSLIRCLDGEFKVFKGNFLVYLRDINGNGWFIRDVLKSNQQIRDQYEKMKTNIAERSGNDRKKYADIKEVECKDFIYSVINDAETGVRAGHDK